MRWLVIPMAFLNACLVMLPKLHAREAIDGSSIAAMGAGTLKEEDSSRLWADWQRAVKGVFVAKPKRRPFSVEAARAIGIEVVIVPATTP